MQHIQIFFSNSKNKIKKKTTVFLTNMCLTILKPEKRKFISSDTFYHLVSGGKNNKNLGLFKESSNPDTFWEFFHRDPLERMHSDQLYDKCHFKMIYYNSSIWNNFGNPK